MRTSDTGARLIRAGLAWSVVLLALAEALRSYALSIAAGGEAYQTADWLINYSGGFVRRGLFGSVYLALFPQGQLGLWGLFSLQVLFCVVPLAYALTWLHKSDYSWLGIALVCGPAALTFTGWDPVAFARKESLALTALTLLAIAAFPYRKSGTQRALTIGALLIFAVGVFSWEANALFLPGIAFLIYLGFRGRASGREGWVYAIGAATISGIGLVASMLFPGTMATAAAVCQAVRAKGLDSPALCDGSIRYLGWTGGQMLRVIRDSFPLYWGYLAMVALGLLPIATSSWFRKYWRVVALCIVALAPLFLVSADYGRWTSIIVMELLICLMATQPKPDGSVQWTPVAVLLYVTTWGIPHWIGPEDTDWPWRGAMHDVLKFLTRYGPRI